MSRFASLRTLGMCLLLATAALGGRAAAQSGDEGVPGQERITSASDAKAMCDAQRAGRAGDAVYLVQVPATGFSFAPYDGKRARLLVDTTKVLRGAGFELLLGTPRGGLELVAPVAANEAAKLVKEQGEGALSLWIWFRSAPLPLKSAQRCLEVYDTDGHRQRLGGVAMGFSLRRGATQLAGGETAELTALRGDASGDGDVGVGAIDVGTAVLADDRGNAPVQVTRAARGQAAALKACLGERLPVGTVVVGMATDKRGQVVEARVELDGVGDAKLASCSATALRAARYPERALRFSVPIAFR